MTIIHTWALMILSLVYSSAVFAVEPELKPTKAKLYHAGDVNLYLICYENDQPSLIIESGFGLAGSDGAWQQNIAQLQQQFSICLYDRAGIGNSEKGPIPFTVNDMATRLATVLDSANIKAPYYFAAHSYGAHIVNAFNNLYPNKTAGAVLIDPPPLGYFYTMASRWPSDFKTDNKALQAQYEFEQTVRDPLFEKVPENVDHLASFEQLKGARNFANKPVITVRKKRANSYNDPEFMPADIAAPMTQLYANSEAFFTGLSTNSKVVYSTSNSHFLHLRDPDLVVAMIKDLLE